MTSSQYAIEVRNLRKKFCPFAAKKDRPMKYPFTEAFAYNAFTDGGDRIWVGVTVGAMLVKASDNPQGGIFEKCRMETDSS